MHEKTNGLEQTFTRFGFQRKTHKADKVGDYAQNWKGEILLSTESEVDNEIEAARDIEVLIVTGTLPMFGTHWRLAAIKFSWIPTSDELQLMGQSTRCIVYVTYNAAVELIGTEELESRLENLGVSLEREALP